jgi:dTDP-4-amino-4,6-dideoxygalactose transaminase
MEEKDKEIWRVENERMVLALQHKHEMEDQERERIVQFQEFDAKQQALAEEYNRKLQSVEQQAITERMKLEHEMHLKIEEMKKREDVTRQELEKEMAKNEREFKEMQEKYDKQLTAIKSENSSNPFLELLQSVASAVTLPLALLFSKKKNVK